MKRWIIRSGVFLLALAGAGFLVALSGIIPIKASSGHWGITRWFLHFSKQRSVATHTLGLDAPPLDDPAAILKGAGHYEHGCRACHGAPGQAPSRIAHMMLPRPPDLVPLVPARKAEELFHVVKHGIKLTGMPAWPAQQRDDEVWAVVAFLQRLPHLDTAAYRQLVYDDAEAPASDPFFTPPLATRDPGVVAREMCARCHGHDGQGRGNDAFPKLAGQRRDYLENALQAYARGQRHSGMMEPLAAALDDKTIRGLADYYARMPVHSTHGEIEPADADLLARGREIATRGLPEHRVPACVECHDPAGPRTRPEYPSLAGQPAGFLELQFQLLQRGQRGGSDYAHVMEDVAGRLDSADVRAVVAYFGALPTLKFTAESEEENHETEHEPP